MRGDGSVCIWGTCVSVETVTAVCRLTQGKQRQGAPNTGGATIHYYASESSPVAVVVVAVAVSISTAAATL